MTTLPEAKLIDKKAAAKLLSVSLRTIDRYIKAKKIQFFRKANRIFLVEEELKKILIIQNRLKEQFKKENGAEYDTTVYNDIDNYDNIDKGVYDNHDNIDTPKKELKIKINSHDNDTTVYNDIDNYDNIDKGVYDNHDNIDKNSKNFSILSNQHLDKTLEEGVYKALYEEAKDELKDAQKKLEGANYKVGQLEAQIKSMVPLLEFRNEQQKLLIASRKFEEEKGDLQQNLEKKEEKIKKERLNRIIAISILFLVSFAQLFFFILMRYF